MKRLTKIKIKYAIISVMCLMILLSILPTFMRYKFEVTANAVGYAKETRQSTYKVKFRNNGGTGTMDDMTISYNVAQNLTSNTFNYAGHYFNGWNTEANGTGTPYSNGQEIIKTDYITGNEIILYAQWVDGIAEVNGTYYPTLQDAIDHTPDNVQTTVTLLANTTEQLTIGTDKIIVFDLGNHTINNLTTKTSIFENNGTIYISNGYLNSNAEPAIINNNGTGVAIISGGTFTATSRTKGQAIWNNGGRVEISGNAQFSSSSTNRATLHNLLAGVMKITGGTVISNNFTAVINDKGSKAVEIGTKDGTVSTSSPIIQGAIYGLDRNGSATFKFYDGIIKGKTLSINNEASVIADVETGYAIAKSEETIDTQNFRTAYLADENDVVTVTFNPRSGTVNETTRKKEIGETLGTLPEPTRTGHTFLGWYTMPNEGDGDEVLASRTINTNVTFYAHWEKNDTAEMGGTIYYSIQDAIDDAPTDNTPTTITLLKSTIENITIAENQNIILEMFNYQIKSVVHNPVIQNYGTLTISDGTILQTSDFAAIDNRETGTLYVTGGNVRSVNGRSAIFSYGGDIYISGDAYIYSNCTGNYSSQSGGQYIRGTVMTTDSTGTITITGGTIISETGNGVSNFGILTIGVKSDGVVDNASPIIQGYTYGVCSAETFNYYDGIIKGRTDTITGTISDQEPNTHQVTGTESIDGKTYHTVYLEND